MSSNGVRLTDESAVGLRYRMMLLDQARRVVRRVGEAALSHLYRVTGESMHPSIYAGDWLLVRRDAYRLVAPTRGDLVIVRDPRKTTEKYVKRVVGLPGEEVSTRDGELRIDGGPLSEPYLDGLPSSVGLETSTWRLGQCQYFLVGDNRAHSTDSREFGPVDVGLMVGKATRRVWPPSRWSRVGAPGHS